MSDLRADMASMRRVIEMAGLAFPRGVLGPEAMDLAAATGVPAMSGKVRLVQERNSGVQPGVLIYAPIYRGDPIALPENPRDYGRELLGWAYAPIRVGDLVEASLRTVNNQDLKGSAVLVYDGPRAGNRTLLFDLSLIHI